MPPRKKTTDPFGDSAVVDATKEKAVKRRSIAKKPKAATTAPRKKEDVSRKTIVLQTMDHEEARPWNKPASHHIALYRNIAVGFFVVTVLLFTAIFFTTSRSATITITYEPSQVQYTDVVHVAMTSADAKTIAGAVLVKPVSTTRTYHPSGKSNVTIPITGKVRIINEHTKDQPLVKTTRLVTPDGKLFRLSRSVVVPAGKEIADVEVYADQPGASSTVSGPMTFTIPGLWEPLQKKIYAKSETTFGGGEVESGVVSEEDMRKAEADIREALIAMAKQQTSVPSDVPGAYTASIVTMDKLTIERNGDVGDAVAQFVLVAKTDAVVVQYRAEELRGLVTARIEKQPVEEYLALRKDLDRLAVRVESYAIAKGQAQLSVSAQLPKIFKEDAALFARENFVGKTREEISQYLARVPGVASLTTDVAFFPYWVKRVPEVGGDVKIEFVVKAQTNT